MRSANRNLVIEVARRTVAEQLRDPRNRELLAGLPKGIRAGSVAPRAAFRVADWRDQLLRPPVAGPT